MMWDINRGTSIDPIRRFDEATAGLTMTDLESADPQRLKEIIRQTGLASIIIPEQYGGQGKTLDDILNVLHYVAQKSPSIAVMLCMHYHTIATISVVPEYFDFSHELLSDVARHNRLVASAFAEGVPAMDIFSSTVRISDAESPDAFRVSGFKKPCTMAGVADYYAVSVTSETGQRGVVVIDGTARGISSKPFWPSAILKAADSNEVCFDGVEVPKKWTLLGDEELLSGIFAIGLSMFNLMVSVAYTGVAVALASKLSPSAQQDKRLYMSVYGKLLQCYYSALGAAKELADLNAIEDAMNSILILRYQNQETIKNIVSLVNENIGSFRFLTDPEVSYMTSACNLISFHPINRTSYESILSSR